jgi:hypothetical protein
MWNNSPHVWGIIAHYKEKTANRATAQSSQKKSLGLVKQFTITMNWYLHQVQISVIPACQESFRKV